MNENPKHRSKKVKFRKNHKKISMTKIEKFLLSLRVNNKKR